MTEFKEFLSELISKVGQDWRKKRANKKDIEVEKVTGINKEKWFETLPEDLRISVEAIVKNMGDSEEVSETFAPVVRALYAIVPEYPLLHWRHLHESIRDGVFDYYKNKQYGDAADQGAKLFAARMRKISTKDIDGTALASLFNFKYESNVLTSPPVIPINELNTESLRNMQEGQAHLTRGLMQGFRNPINHGPMSAVVPALISELDCLNILSLVSYLAAKLEYSEILAKAQEGIA